MLCILRVAMAWFALCGAGAASGQALPNEPLRPLPQSGSFDPARAALGRALFHDLRLSRDNTHSCASCHQLKKGGADGKALSAGAGGLLNRFNTPTIYNSSFNFRQTWTGRHGSVDSLLEHVISRPSVLATTWELVAARLLGDAALNVRFQRAYGQDVAAPLVKDALSHYLASLVTPSRFDRYLRGDNNAISADEKAGYAKFKGFGCVACHQGINVGGNMYQKFGVMRELAPDAKAGRDPGRFELTGREADRHMFRVPSLRNVALTAPYFHHGAVATLEEAVDAMFKYQLGRSASARDKEQIIRFLGSLSGEQMPPPGAQP